MIVAAFTTQASLTDLPPTSAIASASGWVSDVLFGPLATGIAVIAIAWIGFAMLSGRIDLRRGLSVVLGCFLLFGARGIVDGLRLEASSESTSVAGRTPPPPEFAHPKPAANTSNAFDPYAGAAVNLPRE